METKKYKCECCDYETKIKAQFARHNSTRKHEKMYEEQEKQNEMKEQLREEYDIKMEELKEEYENKLLDKNETIIHLENQVNELKAELIICERERDKFEDRFKEINNMVAERVCFVTQEVKAEVNVMKDKMHKMELERQNETSILNERIKEYNRYTKEKDKEYDIIIERMNLKHENELLKSQLNSKQDIIDLSYNIIQNPVQQQIQQIQQAPQQLYIEQAHTPKTKPKPSDPIDFVDSEIEITQIGMDWKEEYPFEEVVKRIYTDDELAPKIYKEYLNGKDYEMCFMEVLIKEIKKDSFYYKNEKDKQNEVFQLYYKDEWLPPEESHAKLYEVIRQTVNYIYWFEVHRDGCVFDYAEKYKTKKPTENNDLIREIYPPIYDYHNTKYESNYERMQNEHSIRAQDEPKYINKIKSRILKNVLI